MIYDVKSTSNFIVGMIFGVFGLFTWLVSREGYYLLFAPLTIGTYLLLNYIIRDKND